MSSGAVVGSIAVISNMNPETRALIKDRAVSVWLKADLDVLARRVSRKDNRPLIAGKDPMEVLEAQAAARYPAYGEADIAYTSAEMQSAPREPTVAERLRELTQLRKRWNAVHDVLVKLEGDTACFA